MSGFFSRSSAPDSVQKTLMHSIFHKQNAVGSFPADYPVLSLYALPALLAIGTSAPGLIIVVCPDAAIIQQRLKALEEAGFSYPDIAALDGPLVPGMGTERLLLEDVNRRRVRLLFVLPERIGTVTFLQILVHTPVQSMVIEHAHQFLPGFRGSSRYHGFFKTLASLRYRPPMVLLAHTLTAKRIRQLQERFGMQQADVYTQPPDMDGIMTSVRFCWSRKQKMNRLIQVLDSLDMLRQSGSVRDDEQPTLLIYTAHAFNAQKLAESLYLQGYQDVVAFHDELAFDEQVKIQTLIQAQPMTVVLSGTPESLELLPERHRNVWLVFWHLPQSLDELLAWVYRYTQPGHGVLQVSLLYTKEDFQQLQNRLMAQSTIPLELRDYQRQWHEQLRRWVFSDYCRVASLEAYLLGQKQWATSRCGNCDRCQTTSFGGFFRRIIQHCCY